MRPKDLEKLHGRLVRFNSFFFVRKLNRAVKIISKFSRSLSGTVRVVDDLKLALRHILEYVQKSEPASISRCVGQTWFIFSYEPLSANAATVGAVLGDPCGSVCSFFGESLNDECRRIFTKSSNHRAR